MKKKNKLSVSLKDGAKEQLNTVRSKKEGSILIRAGNYKLLKKI